MHIFVVDCEKRELIFVFHGEISSILLSFHYRSCSKRLNSYVRYGEQNIRKRHSVTLHVHCVTC